MVNQLLATHHFDDFDLQVRFHSVSGVTAQGEDQDADWYSVSHDGREVSVFLDKEPTRDEAEEAFEASKALNADVLCDCGQLSMSGEALCKSCLAEDARQQAIADNTDVYEEQAREAMLHRDELPPWYTTDEDEA